MAKRKPSREESAPGLARLPRGRHGLPRDFVAENQRGRLINGLIAAVVEHGYNAAGINEIAAGAGVSKRTFYQYFASKQEAYLEAYELIAAHLRQELTAAAEAASSEWPDRLRAAAAALLRTFAANPDLVSFCLIAPLSADPQITARYRLSMQHLLASLVTVIPPPPASRRPSAAAQDGIVGGVAALIVHKVKLGEGERLPELLPDLLELALTPYLGRDEAVRVARHSS